MINLEYLYKTFERNFKGKKIVFYEINSYTENLLENCDCSNVIGIVDRKFAGEVYRGKQVISIAKLVEGQPEAVVLTDELTNIKEVVDRIAGMCNAMGIELMYMTGVRVKEIFDRVEWYQKNRLILKEGDIKEEIFRHDIISFDIFDTLLVRSAMHASDVFDLIETKAKKRGIYVANFKQIRQRALLENGKRNPNIYEIYVKLQELTGLSDEECAELCEMEIQTEIDVLEPRKAIVECLKYAKKCGKKVFLVSDMYFPESVLHRILQCLHVDFCDRIFVSCDYRQLKYEGLFGQYVEETKGTSYLHIGDNSELDGVYAGLFGIDFFLIKSSISMFNESTYAILEKHIKSVADRFLCGQVISHLFNDPFCMYFSDGKLVLQNTYDIGYCFVGPLLTHFMLWLLDVTKKTDARGILFGARDGFLFQKLYQIVYKSKKETKLLENHYFLTSRIACISAGTETEQDIKNVLEAPFECSPREVLIDKFSFEQNELVECEQENFKDKYDYALYYSGQILKKAKMLRENYIKYCEKIHLQKNDKYLFFDLVSRGTSQYYLSRILNVKLEGMYFWHTYTYAADELKSLVINACWEDSDFKEEDNYLGKHYLLLEAILSTDKPSLKKFDVEGNPVYNVEMREEKEIVLMKEVQKGIIDFFERYYCNLLNDEEVISKKVVDTLYSFVDKEYTNIENNEWNSLMLVDEWMNKKVKIDR